MTDVALVIFDCDGVLVDSEVVSNTALAENLERYGLTLSLHQCMREFVGMSMRGVMDKARRLGADLPEAWISEIYDETFAALRAGVPVVDGIPELLTRLDDAAVPYCVVSNGSREKMKITLGQNDLWERFRDCMFSAHELGVSKPDPGLFVAAAKHFGVCPEDCVVIEDSPSGAEGSRRAGMRCLGFSPFGNDAPLIEQGAKIFTRMSDAPALLGLPR